MKVKLALAAIAFATLLLVSCCVNVASYSNPKLVLCKKEQVQLLAVAESFNQKGLVYRNAGYGSMLPLIQLGDYLIIKPIPYSDRDMVGKVVAYKSAYNTFVITHRLLAWSSSGYMVKGDNTVAADIEYVTNQNFIGEVIEIFRAEK